jgi:hypothetical protein
MNSSHFRRLASRYIAAPAMSKPGGLRLIFDPESDGLYNATKVHCVVVADLDGDRIDEYGPTEIPAALERLAQADVLIGHNILNFDLPLLRRLHAWAPAAEVVDTLIVGRLIFPDLTALDAQAVAMGDAPLGELHGRYSLEAWGLRLDVPKLGTEITDWSRWTPEMQARCVGDVRLNKALWWFLKPDGYSRQAVELEHRVAPICEWITADGIPFDRAAAERLHAELLARRDALRAGLKEQFPDINLNSRPQIGCLLEAHGWVPERRTPKTGQPVIDDLVLEGIAIIHPDFAGLAEHALLGRRIAQLATGKEAWLKHVGADGRIHAGLVHIGTPHSRAKHLRPNLAQIPNPKRGTPWGKECRALFNLGLRLLRSDHAAGPLLRPLPRGVRRRRLRASLPRRRRPALGDGDRARARRRSDAVRQGQQGARRHPRGRKALQIRVLIRRRHRAGRAHHLRHHSHGAADRSDVRSADAVLQRRGASRRVGAETCRQPSAQQIHGGHAGLASPAREPGGADRALRVASRPRRPPSAGARAIHGIELRRHLR